MWLPAVGEDSPVVVKDSLEEVVLDVNPPERLTIVLLQMAYLANGRLVVGVVASATTSRAWFRGAHLGTVFVLSDIGHERLLAVVAAVLTDWGTWRFKFGRVGRRKWRGCHFHEGRIRPFGANSGDCLLVVNHCSTYGVLAGC